MRDSVGFVTDSWDTLESRDSTDQTMDKINNRYSIHTCVSIIDAEDFGNASLRSYRAVMGR